MGADLLIIDDPVKNAKEARSPTIRKNHIDWWQSTALTRLHPGGVVIVVMTRWHEGDLGGYLLSRGTDEIEEPFVEVRLPAIAEDNDPLGRKKGEALWPERYGVDELRRIRQAQGSSYWWAAMYQGHPVPEEAACSSAHGSRSSMSRRAPTRTRSDGSDAGTSRPPSRRPPTTRTGASALWSARRRRAASTSPTFSATALSPHGVETLDSAHRGA